MNFLHPKRMQEILCLIQRGLIMRKKKKQIIKGINPAQRNPIARDLCQNPLYKTKRFINRKKVIKKFDWRKEDCEFAGSVLA